jgi:hypothetical protein
MPAIFHLLGLPGVGKFTIASRLVDTLDAAGETARLIDNHLIADPVVCLVPEPFPGGRMDLDVGQGPFHGLTDFPLTSPMAADGQCG